MSAPTPLRNKSEFTFGYRYLFDKGSTVSETADPEEHVKIPAVGFMVTGWAGGVSRPHCCQNIPGEVCELVDIVDEFLSKSALEPYDSKTHRGFWRTMTVRSSRRTKECMIIIMHAPTSGGAGDKEMPDDYVEVVEKEKARLVSVLAKAELTIPDDASPLKVTSIFFQEFDGLSHPPPEHPVQVRGCQCILLVYSRHPSLNLFLALTACVWREISPRETWEMHIPGVSRGFLPGKYRRGRDLIPNSC